MASRRIEFVIKAEPPSRFDKALSRDVPEEFSLSRTRIARLVESGQVRVNGGLVDAKARVVEGDTVEIALPRPEETHLEAQDIPLDVVFEDSDLIVVNKPAGMVVHPAPGSPTGTLANALLHHCGDTLSGVGGEKRPGIVHRIDKETTGLLVVAKTDKAHHGLAAQFERHTVERKYFAVVFGVPDAADPRLRGVRGATFEPGNILRLTTGLDRHKTDRQRQAVIFDGGRHAVTRARVIEAFGKSPTLALVECWLETGRTHQIRVHMAHAGHGLVGDPIYGGRRKLPSKALSEQAFAAISGFGRQALHAGILGFRHPVSGQDMRFEAPLPADLANLLGILRS